VPDLSVDRESLCLLVATACALLGLIKSSFMKSDWARVLVLSSSSEDDRREELLDPDADLLTFLAGGGLPHCEEEVEVELESLAEGRLNLAALPPWCLFGFAIGREESVPELESSDAFEALSVFLLKYFPPANPGAVAVALAAAAGGEVFFFRIFRRKSFFSKLSGSGHSITISRCSFGFLVPFCFNPFPEELLGGCLRLGLFFLVFVDMMLSYEEREGIDHRYHCRVYEKYILASLLPPQKPLAS
jgi:hypothetical protein